MALHTGKPITATPQASQANPNSSNQELLTPNLDQVIQKYNGQSTGAFDSFKIKAANVPADNSKWRELFNILNVDHFEEAESQIDQDLLVDVCFSVGAQKPQLLKIAVARTIDKSLHVQEFKAEKNSEN